MTTKKGKYILIHRHKSSTHRIAAQPQKRGVKGYYTGSRLVFLEGYRDEYTLLRGKNRHQFWHEFYNAWWKKYPWRLGDEQEPPTNDLEKMRSLSYVGGEKDVEEKAEVEAKAREVSSIVENFLRLWMIDAAL